MWVCVPLPPTAGRPYQQPPIGQHCNRNTIRLDPVNPKLPGRRRKRASVRPLGPALEIGRLPGGILHERHYRLVSHDVVDHGAGEAAGGAPGHPNNDHIGTDRLRAMGLGGMDGNERYMATLAF